MKMNDDIKRSKRDFDPMANNAGGESAVLICGRQSSSRFAVGVIQISFQ